MMCPVDIYWPGEQQRKCNLTVCSRKHCKLYSCSAEDIGRVVAIVGNVRAVKSRHEAVVKMILDRNIKVA